MVYKRENLIKYALDAGLDEEGAKEYAEHMMNPVIVDDLDECCDFCDDLYEELKNGEWDIK